MNKTEVIVWVLSFVSIILWWSLVNFDKFEELGVSYAAFLRSAHSLQWLSEVLSHLAFYGSVAAGLIGFEKETSIAYCFAVWWFFVALYFSHSLMKSASAVSVKQKSSNSSVKEIKNAE